MSFFKEFKEFAMKGNVMDLAVGVIIGGAFGKIVTSLVDNILMPIVGLFTGGADFSERYTLLNTSKGSNFESLSAAKEAGAPVLAYGAFIQSVLDFLIIAVCIFLIIRFMNRLIRKREAAPAPPSGPSAEEKLLMEIRDAIKSK